MEQIPLFEKVTTNSPGRHPLYHYLIEAQPRAQVRPGSHLRGQLDCYGFGPKHDSDVLWKFEKFLVDRQGAVVSRFAPDMPPDDRAIISTIEASLLQC